MSINLNVEYRLIQFSSDSLFFSTFWSAPIALVMQRTHSFDKADTLPKPKGKNTNKEPFRKTNIYISMVFYLISDNFVYNLYIFPLSL